jgi:hypothetical protein
MSPPKTGERAIAIHDRQRRALEFRRDGCGYQEIADKLGYASKSGAFKAVIAALRQTLQEPADAVRQLELERLDAMLHAIWPSAQGGDLKAVDAVVRLMDRRARYLGLDTPQRIDIEAKVRVMAEQLGLDPDAAVAEAARILRDTRG